jgi:hypothetical protein
MIIERVKQWQWFSKGCWCNPMGWLSCLHWLLLISRNQHVWLTCQIWQTLPRQPKTAFSMIVQCGHMSCIQKDKQLGSHPPSPYSLYISPMVRNDYIPSSLSHCLAPSNTPGVLRCLWLAKPHFIVVWYRSSVYIQSFWRKALEKKLAGSCCRWRAWPCPYRRLSSATESPTRTSSSLVPNW